MIEISTIQNDVDSLQHLIEPLNRDKLKHINAVTYKLYGGKQKIAQRLLYLLVKFVGLNTTLQSFGWMSVIKKQPTVVAGNEK